MGPAGDFCRSVARARVNFKAYALEHGLALLGFVCERTERQPPPFPIFLMSAIIAQAFQAIHKRARRPAIGIEDQLVLVECMFHSPAPWAGAFHPGRAPACKPPPGGASRRTPERSDHSKPAARRADARWHFRNGSRN